MLCCVVLCVVNYEKGDKMTKSISLTEILKKMDKVYNISKRDTESLIIPLVTFKKIMMLYPEDGPVISCERTIKEKYRCMKEFGILNQSGRINFDEFCRWVAE